MIYNIVSTLLLLLCLAKMNLCKNSIKIEDDLSLDKLANQLSTYIIGITKAKSDTANLVHFVLPTEKDSNKTAQLIEKTIQKVSNIWTVTINDSYSCDSLEEWHIPYENKFLEFVQDVYVVPINHEKKIKFFEAQLQIMSREDSFNPKAVFILVSLTDQCGEIKYSYSQNVRIFNNLWKYSCFNATVLIISTCDFAMTVVTAKPFSQENQCRTIEEKGLQYYYLPQLTKSMNYSSFLHEKPTNFQGCVFWAGTIPYPPYVVGEAVIEGNETKFNDARGIDIEIMRTLSDKVNLTIKFYQTHTFGMDAWVTVLENGTIIGFVQDLLDHKIDISFGGIMPSYVTFYKLDYSTTYKFSTLNLFVPDADILPPWLIFLKVFSLRVWTLSAAVFILVTFIYHIISLQTLRGIDTSFLELFKLCIGFSSTLNPGTSYVRILFFSWAVYCVHWNIAYTTMMFLLLTSPPRDKEISTFKDLKNSGLEVSVNAIYLEVFGHIEIDKTTTSVLKNHVVCQQIELCVAQFVKNRNFSVMGTAETLEFLINWQRTKIHKLPENVLTFSVSFLANKGNPLIDEVSSVIRQTFHAGLLSKWEKDVGRSYRLNNAANDLEEKVMILDLKGAFYILFIGNVIAFLVLLMEITVKMFTSGKRSSVNVFSFEM